MDWTLLTQITGLALADAINVCALAVLTAVLINILTNNAENSKKVLHAGFAFIAAIFIGYLFYSYLLVQIFKTLAEQIRGITPILYNGFAILIMIVGALNVKDFFVYQRGNIATEMPLSLRPKVNRLIKKINSPKGAFVIGIFVTIFLLPCTIAPLMVAANLLAGYSLLGLLPWFIYYIAIFVLPMIVITLAVYFGSLTTGGVEHWRKKNIKILHLLAGILLFVIGLSILTGWL